MSRALYEYPDPVGCSPHPVDGVTNLTCAWVEGWGDFFAVYILGADLVASSGSYNDTDFELNRYYNTPSRNCIGQPVTNLACDGSRIEGAVAAFLLDIVDNTSSPDDIPGDDDPLALSPSYLATAVKTCRISTPGVPWLQVPNGIDHIIYCLETTVDPTVAATYFVTRYPKPTQVFEGATEVSPPWNQSFIRFQWLFDLFGQ